MILEVYFFLRPVYTLQIKTVTQKAIESEGATLFCDDKEQIISLQSWNSQFYIPLYLLTLSSTAEVENLALVYVNCYGNQLLSVSHRKLTAMLLLQWRHTASYFKNTLHLQSEVLIMFGKF